MTYQDPEDKGLAVRKSAADVFEVKCRVMSLYQTMQDTEKRISSTFDEINGYPFHGFDMFGHISMHSSKTETRLEKAVDYRCWKYLIGLYSLEKYMLCTEHQKMMKQIEEFDFPTFTVENADAWLSSLKHLVYESIQKLIEDVFERITQGTYRTGSSYNAPKKKRNNNGIDQFFIVYTGDYNERAWYRNNPTLTDDMEKACYIIDGKMLPEVTIKAQLNTEKKWAGENEYFSVTFCKNGNTHYKWKREDIRDRLNLYGSKRGVIGENVKIKVFEK